MVSFLCLFYVTVNLCRPIPNEVPQIVHCTNYTFSTNICTCESCLTLWKHRSFEGGSFVQSGILSSSDANASAKGTQRAICTGCRNPCLPSEGSVLLTKKTGHCFGSWACLLVKNAAKKQIVSAAARMLVAARYRRVMLKGR